MSLTVLIPANIEFTAHRCHQTKVNSSNPCKHNILGIPSPQTMPSDHSYDTEVSIHIWNHDAVIKRQPPIIVYSCHKISI
eukprot:scaffold4078_cov25-Cyclotella_meneghiniana.AAC.2